MKRRGILVAIAMVLFLPGTSFGQASDSENAPEEASSPDPSTLYLLDELVVVGSRAEGRSVVDSPVPVDVVRAEDILQTGETEMGRVIQTLIPSFNFSSSTISDGTDSVRPATLRGMGPDQVLVLVNGRRRHGSALIHVNTSVGRGTAGTDLNAIPVGAVERIEVLRDGASAQYGSDAVAGVINIVLKNDLEGSIQTQWGQYSHGDGDRFTARINKGFQVGDDGVVHVAVEFMDRDRTNRAGRQGAVQYPDSVTCPLGSCTADQLDPARQTSLLKTHKEGATVLLQDPGDKERNFDRRRFRIGDSELEQVSGALNFEKPIDALWKDAEVYAFANFSRAENESGGFYRRANQFGRNPYLEGLFPQGSQYPDGFLPHIETTVWDYAGGGGLSKRFDNGITADLSVVHGGNDFGFLILNSHNASWVNRSLGQNAPFLDGAGNPVFPGLDASGAPDSSADAGSLQLYLTTVNLDFTLTANNNMFLAWGGEYKRDQYEIVAGEEYSYADYDGSGGGSAGIQVFPGFKPANEVDETRHAFALYADSELYLTDWLMVSPAARYEHYSDFGNTVNGKVAGKWDLTDWFSLRGSASSGFRAPSMQQLYFNNTSTQFVTDPQTGVTLAEERGTFRNDSRIAEAIGIPELEEETSINLSAGFVFQPVPSFSLTTDFYHIEVEDRIILSGNVTPTGAGVPSSVADSLIAQGVSSGQFFMNAADTRTQGFDFVGVWNVPYMPLGDLTLKAVGSMSKTEIRKVNLPSGLPSSLFTATDRGILEGWQPKSHFLLNGVYRLEQFAVSISLHRYGQYKVHEGGGNFIQNYNAKWLTDIQLSYNLGRFGILKAGANNLFDVQPERNRIGQSRGGTIIDTDGNTIVDSPGVFRYSRRSAPFGFNGAFYYVGFEYRI